MTFSTDWLTEFTALPIAAIALSDPQIAAARTLSDRIALPRRWGFYLSALSLIGFEQWLDQRTPAVRFNRQQCRILEPISLDAHTVVCRLQVNDFRVCLITTDSSPDPLITVPPVVLQTPDLLAHIYVAIAVLEEVQQVIVQGWLRHDQLQQQHRATPLPPLADGSYSLSPDWFEPDCDRLLSIIDLLDPTVIPLAPLNAIVQQPRWQQLKQILVQPVINAGQWLNQQLDEAATGLHQILLPPIAASELRIERALRDRLSPTEALLDILLSLARSGLEFPPNTNTLYQDLQLADLPLRVYSLTAPLPETDEWSLCVILSRSDGLPLATGTQVQISDGLAIVAARTLELRDRANFLYAQVAGNLDEQLLVSVVLADGVALQLPPFTFHVDL